VTNFDNTLFPFSGSRFSDKKMINEVSRAATCDKFLRCDETIEKPINKHLAFPRAYLRDNGLRRRETKKIKLATGAG
jgi:hypothetical protein